MQITREPKDLTLVGVVFDAFRPEIEAGDVTLDAAVDAVNRHLRIMEAVRVFDIVSEGERK